MDSFFNLVEKVSVATAGLLIVAFLQQKARRRVKLQNNKYGLERLLAELEAKNLAAVVELNQDADGNEIYEVNV